MRLISFTAGSFFPKVRKYLPLLSMVFFIPLCFAATSGKISGKVIDQNTGIGLIGVNVFIDKTNIGTATDADGTFMIINVPPGSYSLKFMMIGYNNNVTENVIVRSDHTTRINAELNPSIIEGQSVTIVAEKPIIEIDRTSTAAYVSAEQLELMPVQTVEDVLNLQAGVVDGHFRGGRANEVAYMIDGIPVNDTFNNNAALVVENDVIQELKVISGTFNAEYGQAQSAIVEMITREGGTKLSANASVSSGDFLSGNGEVFRNINSHSLSDYSDYSISLNGPLIGRANFLFNFRNTQDQGYKYGRDYFERSVNNGDIWYSDSSGEVYDNYDYVYDPGNSDPDTSTFFPMDDYRRTSVFGKLLFWLSNKDKISLNVTYQKKDRAVYDHMFQYNPRGNSRIEEESTISYLVWNRMLSQSAYIIFSASNSSKRYHRFLFKNKFDPRYSTDSRFRDTGNFSFYTGGTDMRYFKRQTDTRFAKIVLTDQVNHLLEIKAGAEVKMHSLQLDSLKLKKNPETGFEVQIAPPHTADNQKYHRKPIEGAAFIQTKLETKSITMNAGIRFDYFDSNGEILDDFLRPQTSTRSHAKKVMQISPRFGLAYPISDSGVMHVSYGHFFQIPAFAYLYRNPDFIINPEEGTSSVLNDPFGNAALKPQKTVAYEIGLQQQLNRNISFEVTAYYKDIRNLLSTEINTVAPLEEFAGIKYGRYINSDYGQVKGFTLMFEKAMSDGFSASIDYTFSVAKGNASDPNSALIDQQSDPPVESEKQLLPLDWDQRHSLNTQITLAVNRGGFITIIGKMGTGMPYNLEPSANSVHLRNGGRKPVRVLFDVLGSKNFKTGNVKMKLTVKVYNVFDRLNELNVYSDSGRASFTEDLINPGVVQGANSKAEFYNRPDWYSPPRQILIGLSFEL